MVFWGDGKGGFKLQVVAVGLANHESRGRCRRDGDLTLVKAIQLRAGAVCLAAGVRARIGRKNFLRKTFLRLTKGSKTMTVLHP